MVSNMRGITKVEDVMKKITLIKNIALVILIEVLLTAGCQKISGIEQTIAETSVPVDAGTEATEAPAQEENNEPAFVCLPEIVPGETSREDVLRLMGEPLASEIAEDGSETLSFTSDVEFIPNAVLIMEDIAQSTSALNRDESLTLPAIQEKFGEAEEITYSYFSQGTLTYLYPQQGFAVIAEPEGGQVYWMECYVPMYLEDYMSGFGSALPMEDPYNR